MFFRFMKRRNAVEGVPISLPKSSITFIALPNLGRERKSMVVGDAPGELLKPPFKPLYLRESPFMKRRKIEGTKKGAFALCLKEQRHRLPGPLHYLQASCMSQRFTTMTESCSFTFATTLYTRRQYMLA